MGTLLLMSMSTVRPFLLALALASPLAAGAQPADEFVDYIANAQPSASQSVGLTIEGYARASADVPTVVLTPSASGDAQVITVQYSTNYAPGRDVYVRLEGEMDGVRLRVEPDGGPSVERVANAGSAGTPVAYDVVGPEPGPVVTGAGQVVASQRFRVVATADGPAPLPSRAYVVTVEIRRGDDAGRLRTAPRRTSAFDMAAQINPFDRSRPVAHVPFTTIDPAAGGATQAPRVTLASAASSDDGAKAAWGRTLSRKARLADAMAGQSVAASKPTRRSLVAGGKQVEGPRAHAARGGQPRPLASDPSLAPDADQLDRARRDVGDQG